MRVTFVLPVEVDKPVGGFKVVYEYANRLAQRGHAITVVHRNNDSFTTSRKEKLREEVVFLRKQWDKRPIAQWFPVRPEVSLKVVREVTSRTLPDADALIATAWQTASWVNNAGARKGKKYYLIQHDETCMGPVDEVNSTWRLPLHKIVIAEWLRDKATGLGETATHIPNGMDFGPFSIQRPLDGRFARVGMLFHSDFEWKGSADGLEAILLAKREVPELAASLFGTGPRPATIPDWVEYQCLPTPDELCRIYNRCSVFLQPSWTEGWGLTATEAMACGCALVTTDNGGSRDYAQDGVTALVSPPHQSAFLSKQIVRLLQNDAMRIAIAQAGAESIRRYTWDRAVNSLEDLVKNA